MTAAKAGATGQVTVRCDSAYCNHDVIAAARTGGARFSITARMDPAVTRVITQIPDCAWVGIKYPHAIYGEQEGRWVSDAEVAETSFTAFTSRKKSEHISARLIVRRVKRLNPTTVPAGQGALFTTWRHHAVFTDSGEAMLAAEATHRDHAIIEKVIAELKAGPLAHLLSGSFAAKGAWLVLAASSFNLTRAAGTLASRFHARATTATIRTQLIAVPARIARSARRPVSTCPSDGPGKTPGRRCSPPPTNHPPARPDHPAPAAQPRTRSERPGQTGNPPTPESEITHPRPDQVSPESRPVDRGSHGTADQSVTDNVPVLRVHPGGGNGTVRGAQRWRPA